MPKTTKSGKAKKAELPSTLQRSGRKAQQTFAETYDSAMAQYGDEQRSYQTAFASLKHTHEKVGDHWEPKSKKGPSDPRAKNPRARQNKGKSYGGVDYYGNSKKELYERAKKLGIEGRSSMSKDELAEAISRKQ
jgi:hypothetical protein